MFHKIEKGVHVDVKRAYQSPVVEDYNKDWAFTLTLQQAKKEEIATTLEKIAMIFKNEADYFLWLDGFRMIINDAMSLLAISDTSYISLFRIYNMMAINDGIAKLEKDLISLQPSVPPMPPVGPESFSVKETPSIDTISKANIANRRSNFPVGIQSPESEDDDVDDNIDELVDSKLTQLQLAFESKEEVQLPELTVIPPPSPRGVLSPRSNTISSPRDVPSSPRAHKVDSPRHKKAEKRNSGWLRSSNSNDTRPTRRGSFLDTPTTK